MAMTTLSFFPCSEAGCGSRESAAIAAVTRMSFLNIQTLLNGTNRMARQSKTCIMLSRLAGHRRQRHDGLGVVTGGRMAETDAARQRRDRAAMRVGERAAGSIGATG